MVYGVFLGDLLGRDRAPPLAALPNALSLLVALPLRSKRPSFDVFVKTISFKQSQKKNINKGTVLKQPNT